GGAGSNTLNISYVSGLGDFVSRRLNGETWQFIDANSGTINVSNILVHSTQGDRWWSGSLTAGSKQYTLVDDMRHDTSPFSGAYGSVQAFVYQSGSSVEVALVENGKFLPQYRMGGDFGGGFGGFSLTGSETYTVHGTTGKDVVFTGYQADLISTGDGNDFIFAGDGADTIYAGAGNDVVYLSYAALTEDVVIDGGSGSNTLAFIKPGEAGGWDNDSYGAITLDMSSLGVATGFHNIVGTAYADTITGDSQSNVLVGNSGNDVINGGQGADIIYGDHHEGDSSGVLYGLNYYWAQSQGNDSLLGGEGNDQLFGGGGNDVLDGGTGVDTLTGGSGIDTFVLRIGDGGNTIAGADTITDFQDGTDVLGLAGSLTYSDLIISQGNGTDTANTNTLIKTSSGEYLAVLLNTQAANVNYMDFAVLSATPLSLTGTAGDDVLLGAFGDDSISGGGGNDIILARDGNDAITVGGNGGQSFTTTVDGGAGSNTLNISYVSGLGDFVSRRLNGETWQFIDANSGTINVS
ncbi:MAG: calcium-binding protein, partial [Alphaproteobacteria bacterium]|nr:calcium-binding protein [Alphaproteobacteria bacterium]